MRGILFGLLGFAGIFGLALANAAGDADTPQVQNPEFSQSRNIAVLQITQNGGLQPRLVRDEEYLTIYGDGRLVAGNKYDAGIPPEWKLPPEQLNALVHNVVTALKDYDQPEAEKHGALQTLPDGIIDTLTVQLKGQTLVARVSERPAETAPLAGFHKAMEMLELTRSKAVNAWNTAKVDFDQAGKLPVLAACEEGSTGEDIVRQPLYSIYADGHIVDERAKTSAQIPATEVESLLKQVVVVEKLMDDAGKKREMRIPDGRKPLWNTITIRANGKTIKAIRGIGTGDADWEMRFDAAMEDITRVFIIEAQGPKVVKD